MLAAGGAPEELLQKDYIKNGVFSRTGFRGCLASMDLSGQVPDLGKFAQQQSVTIFDSCQCQYTLLVGRWMNGLLGGCRTDECMDAWINKWGPP